MGLKRKIIAVSLCLIMMLSSINVNVIDAKAETVTVSVKNNPKIDVMLTSKETSLDLSNFENDIKKSLQNKGIDTSNIKIQTGNTTTIDTSNSDASQIFNSWTTFPYNATSNWYYQDGYISSNVNEAYETGFIDQSQMASDISLDGTLYVNEYIQPMGYILRMSPQKDNPNRYNMYMLWVSGWNGVNYNSNINGIGTTAGNATSASTPKRTVVLFKVEGLILDYNIWKNYTTGGTYSATPLASTMYSGTMRLGWPYHMPRNYGGYPDGIVLKEGVTAINTGDSELKTTILGYANLDLKTSTGKDTFNLGIEAKGNNFTVKYDYSKLFSVQDSSFKEGYYGIFEYSHVSPRFYAIKADISSYISFNDLLTQPKWREDAEHVIVNVDNNIDDTLTGSDTMGEILSRTLADKIHFIQWGTETNKSASKDFIARNDNNGLFTYNNNYNQAVEDTVNYIISLIKQNSDSNYVIAGEDTDLEVSPANLKNNAVSSTYPNGRWLIKHDDTYFANSEGKIADTYQKNLSYDFSKSGKYEIYFDGQKVKEIYAHRKPVADFDIAISGSKLTLTSKSYDLDSNDDVGYGAGITSEKWYYKEATATKWTSGKLNTFTKNKIYIIKLDVTDKQGVTSSAIKYVGTGLPVANFNISSSTITTADKLIVKDTSYDPQGNDITKYEWVLKKNGTTIGTYTSKEFPDINFNASGYKEGTYNITLKITNNIGTESKAFTKTFTVETAKYKNKYEHWAWGFNNEGNNNTKQAFLLQTTYGEETYGEEFSPDASYALTVPNGYTLAPRFGNGQITGKWTTFNFGTKITQPSYVMNFEYDYYPTDYTVTYNLDGGTNNSFNPDSYTVLYGVTFAEPTKKGYDFLGWYDANGNKITGINEGCNATFSDTADLYSKLKTRTTGNISVTAKWKKHDYSITTNKTGSGAISNSGIVTYTNNTSVFIIPAEGYITSSLKIDGVSVSPVTKYNFLNVEKDHKVEAIFTISQNRKMELMQKGYKWIDLKL